MVPQIRAGMRGTMDHRDKPGDDKERERGTACA
jgi:hypothetical protein